MPYLSQLSVITPPAQQPVTVQLVREHTRIYQNADSDLMTFYIDSATQAVQTFLDRSLITQTLKYNLVRTTNANSWPLAPAPLFILPMGVEWALQHMTERDIGLPRSPIQSVTSLITDAWGTDPTTLTLNIDYNVDFHVDPGRVHLINGNSWDQRSYISITYVSGYGNDATLIPTPILHALLLTVASMYENRGDEAGGDLPTAAKNLLWPYRLTSFGQT